MSIGFCALGEFCLLGVERDSGHGEFGGVVLEFGEFASSAFWSLGCWARLVLGVLGIFLSSGILGV